MQNLTEKTIFFLGLIPFIFFNCAQRPDIPASQSDNNYRAEKIIDGLGSAWGMVWLTDGDMLITERSGNIRVFRDGQLLDKPVAGVPNVFARNQGGLLDIELHPNYASNGWLYISYSSSEGPGSGANTAIMRARFDRDSHSLTDQQVLYKAEPNSNRGQHFGSRIEFDRDGYLYFSIGDRGNRDVNPQDITRDGGKIYRIMDDGSIPDDNPFVDESNAKKAIYSYGHRNPQGMDLNPETGTIWIHEHGPRGGDEINIIEKGANYGWPEITFGINYSGTTITEDTAKAGMEQPEWYWDPSIAPSGMTFVTGDRYPEWNGDLLVGSLKFNYLVWCRIEKGNIVSEEVIFEDIGRVRNIRQGPDGYLYVATDGTGIFKLVPDS